MNYDKLDVALGNLHAAAIGLQMLGQTTYALVIAQAHKDIQEWVIALPETEGIDKRDSA